MAHLRLSLLGSFQITLDGRPVLGFKSNKARALLAYLAVEADRPHRREALAGLLWPDWPDRDALGNLRYTLSNLRQVICDPQAEPPFLLISHDSLQFNLSSDHWVDVTAFAQMADVDRSHPSAMEQLQKAVDLYQGSFLEGFSLADSPAFEEWTLYTRERLARQVSSALHFLAASCERRSDYEQAQAYTWKLLELEPSDETAHQLMMRVLALGGQRSAALTQYQTCCRVLAEELNVEPGQETTRLYEQIRDGRLKAAGALPVSSPDHPAPLTSFLKQEPSRVKAPVFVARENELKQLDRFLDLATSGQGRVAFVTGEAGSGKTALLQAFAWRAEQAHPDLVVAGGNCSAYTGIGDPYLPFREILELLTGDIEAKGAAGTITQETARRLWLMLPAAMQALVDIGPDLIDTFLPRAPLRERARMYAPGSADWQTRLTELLERKPPSSFGYPGPQQNDLFEQYTKVLRALSQSRPLLLLLDDLQWADPGSISLVFHLGRHLSGSRTLVVGAYRPEEVALETDGKRHPLESVVNELRRGFGEIMVNVDKAEGPEFIDAFLDSEPNRLGSSFRQMLYLQTRGHPLFTIELLRGLQERGDLVHDADGRWTEGPSLDWEMLPARVEAAIRERIDRMPEAFRRALAVASVEGEEFTAEVVARVRTVDEREALEHLSGELDRRHRLIRAQSIQRVDGQTLSRYRFRHILFQKYLYGSLDEVERVHLHEQVGTALEGLYGVREDVATIAVQLARHFQEAGITQKAIHYLHQAGDEAVRRSAHDEGLAHLTGALALLKSQPDSPERTQKELALQLSLGKARMRDTLGPEREGAITRARELCRQTGSKAAELCQVLGQLSIFYYVRAQYQKAREFGEEMLSLAQQSGDPLLVALVHWHLGFILFATGDYPSARAHLQQVISFYQPTEHHHSFVLLHGLDAGVSAMSYDACCLWCLGYPDQALRRSREALALARRLDHAFSLIDVLCYGGCLFDKMRQDLRALKEDAEELMGLSKGIFSSFGGTGTCYRGDALAQLGQVQEGMKQMRAGLAARRSRGSLCYSSGMLGSLAEAQALAGRPDEGMITLAEAFAFVEESGERIWEAELHRLRGEVLLALGDESGAETSLQAAIETARSQQAKSWELRAATSLCRLWQRQGKITQAGSLLKGIYNWFTEGLETRDLIEAGKLLKELSG